MAFQNSCSGCWRSVPADRRDGFHSDDCRLAAKRKVLKKAMIAVLGFRAKADRPWHDTRPMAEELRAALERRRLPEDLDRDIDRWGEAQVDAMLAHYDGSPRHVW